ncbi:MAG: hypothetical protein AAF797_06440 [Planctomycetota bacterium]
MPVQVECDLRRYSTIEDIGEVVPYLDVAIVEDIHLGDTPAIVYPAEIDGGHAGSAAGLGIERDIKLPDVRAGRVVYIDPGVGIGKAIEDRGGIGCAR